MEGSAVTFGANQDTPVLDVSKSENRKEYLDKLNEKMFNLINALKNGKGTDDRLETFENQLRVLQAKYNSLINLEPIMNHSKEDEPNDNNHKQFYLNLI